MKNETAESFKPTAIHLSRKASLGFDGGTLIVHLSGPGAEIGSGRFIFDENDVQWVPHDEREGCYLEVKVAHSEMVELRDWLTEWLGKTEQTADEERGDSDGSVVAT